MFLRNVMHNLFNNTVTNHSDRAISGMKRFHSLEHWGRGFESHSRHGCLSTFILCLCCIVYVEALGLADLSFKESYRLYKD
jgi:hypothetical protein